jgi:hypothetical protein
LARIQKDFKTEGELSEALMLLDVFDEWATRLAYPKLHFTVALLVGAD